MFEQSEPTGWTWLGRLADVIGIVGIPTLAVLYRKLRNRLRLHAIKATPLEINSGFKGLICSVSAPYPPSSDPARDVESMKKMVEENDNPSAALLATPIGSVLKAITQHERYLTHCWLLASPDCKPYLGALVSAIQKYFPAVENLVTVDVRDVYYKVDDVYNAVHNIFNSCKDAGILPRDIIADVTAGTKVMSIAMAMACLDRDRNIQYQEQKERKNFYRIDISYEKISKRPMETNG